MNLSAAMSPHCVLWGFWMFPTNVARVASLAIAMTMVMISAGHGQHDAYATVIARSVPPSKEVRNNIANATRNFLLDPYSVRDTAISNVADFGNGTQGVCVAANVKNAMGGYTGRKAWAVTMSGMIILDAQVSHPLCARPDIKWHKYPELDALKNL